MGIVDRWLLPDGVEDILPSQAKKLEEVRRRLLDLFSTWGYDYVTVSYTHLRAHETGAYLVCRLLLEKKKHPRRQF